MLLVFNVDGFEWRTMDAFDVSRAMDFADDIARLSYGRRPRGIEWVNDFVRMARKLGYGRSSAVRVCTCCTLNGAHNPDCGLVKRVGPYPTYAPPLPEELPLVNLPFEWPAARVSIGERTREASRFALVPGPIRREKFAPVLKPLVIETPRKHGKGLPFDDSIPLEAHGIIDSDPDVISFGN